MNIEHLKRVQELVEMKAKILIAIDEAKAWMADLEEGETSSYWCNVHENSDGSGRGIDLNGCDVGLAVVRGTLAVLEAKLVLIDEELVALGVEL